MRRQGQRPSCPPLGVPLLAALSTFACRLPWARATCARPSPTPHVNRAALPWRRPLAALQGGFAPMDLGDIPMDLLDDIAPLPMHAQPAAASGATSGRSGATVALASSASRGSGDMCAPGQALGSTSSTSWHPAVAQQAAQQAWRAAPRQPPPTLPSSSSVAPGVLASVHGMLSVPGMVAAGQAAPLVGYGMQPSVNARKLISLSLKVKGRASWLTRQCAAALVPG